jgi:deoxyribodipyrimidine photo-lyase
VQLLRITIFTIRVLRLLEGVIGTGIGTSSSVWYHSSTSLKFVSAFVPLKPSISCKSQYHFQYPNNYRYTLRSMATTTSNTNTGNHDQRRRTTLINEKVQHISRDQLPDWMLKERTRILYEKDPTTTTTATKPSNNQQSVVYWMQRDVRTSDNWAFLLAIHYAMQYNATLHVVYALQPPPPSSSTTSNDTDDEATIPDLIHLPMTERHGQFLLGGLECVYNDLSLHNIPLHVVMSKSIHEVGSTVATLLESLSCTVVITDFSPLRHYREWKEIQLINSILDNTSSKVSTITSVYQVDTHNVVPVWMASTYREYGARTIRPKINKQYQAYLQKFPKWNDLITTSNISSLTKNADVVVPPFQRLVYETYMKMDASVPVLAWAKPGTDAALEQVQAFFELGLSKFDTHRNDPNYKTICSNLSPWINHGHVSFQRITMAVKKFNKYANGTASYLEEGIVRRELSDNYCYYDPYKYDTLFAAADWAQETLRVHSTDVREYVYTLEEFETGCTHDDLWNAAQLQAVRDGKMHGFLRMYWAKKILEWTTSPTEALQIALYLNDKFNIDGRDPNGFVGVGWSIMGIHDMGWKEREIFGKIRFMNYAGCKRKYVVIFCMLLCR